MLNAEYKKRYLSVRKKILELLYAHLNPMQRQAVFNISGPVIVLAGAGSGKTTVIIERIAYMLKYGDAYNSESVPAHIKSEDVEILEGCLAGNVKDIEPQLVKYLAQEPINPYSIMAITFTNKAANELSSRLEKKVGEDSKAIWACTFHSACVRILRKFIDKLSYERSFNIYDTDDSKAVIKECMRALNIDDKVLMPKSALNQISRWKDETLNPEDAKIKAGGDFRLEKIAEIYKLYMKKLKEANALDFDDIILKTFELLKEYPEVRKFYNDRFEYLMVDEYQDTNMLQHKLCSLLCSDEQNICIVGDDDQSIYKFRGATVQNILGFEKEYKKTRLIKLEQNYRSTGVILNAANSVIMHNKLRKGKNLWTENQDGELITVYNAGDDREEAEFVADKILESAAAGEAFNNFAVLYRTNAQSSVIETAFAKSGIPYRLIGAHRFNDRMEIKDLNAYMFVINNPHDDVRLKRIINTPKRGIGNTTVEKMQILADSLGTSIYYILKNANKFEILSTAKTKLAAFCNMIDNLIEMRDKVLPAELFNMICEASGYRQMFEMSKEPEAKDRLENIGQLYSNIVDYQERSENPSLEEYLEEVSLISDIDNYDQTQDAVTGMTVHSAKGLEFENVFIIGMEEMLFPSSMSSFTQEDIEEERRLCYVAITRAKKKLYMTHSNRRMRFGKTDYMNKSRFIDEIPEELVDFQKSSQIFDRNTFQVKNIDFSEFKEHKFKQSAGVAIKKQDKNNENDYKIGMMIRHNVFGEGKILKVTPMANDVMLEIDFSGIHKKIMANFAKLKII